MNYESNNSFLAPVSINFDGEETKMAVQELKDYDQENGLYNARIVADGDTFVCMEHGRPLDVIYDRVVEVISERHVVDFVDCDFVGEIK